MTIEDSCSVGTICRPSDEALVATGRAIKKRKRSEKIGLGKSLVYSLPVEWNLQKVFDACLHVFKGPGTVPCSRRVRKLCRILDRMDPEDLGLSRSRSFFQPKHESEGTPRVTTATIYKCHNFEMCLFLLPSNALIPLHNHPEMTVFSKLLIGKMHVKAYDWAADQEKTDSSLPSPTKGRLAKLKADKVLSAPSEASVLYPTWGGNIHEFRALSPCAFLDIIGPPYSKDANRDCSFYRETEESELACHRYLEEIDPPEESEMDGIEYMGPQIVVSAS